MTFIPLKFKLPPSIKALFESEYHAETGARKPQKKTTPHKETGHEFCEDSHIAHWEDEGGAHINCPHPSYRKHSLGSKKKFTPQMDTANT